MAMPLGPVDDLAEDLWGRPASMAGADRGEMSTLPASDTGVGAWPCDEGGVP